MHAIHLINSKLQDKVIADFKAIVNILEKSKEEMNTKIQFLYNIVEKNKLRRVQGLGGSV
jgi:hypothetical protein